MHRERKAWLAEILRVHAHKFPVPAEIEALAKELRGEIQQGGLVNNILKQTSMDGFRSVRPLIATVAEIAYKEGYHNGARNFIGDDEDDLAKAAQQSWNINK